MTKLDLGNANNEKIENLNLIALRKYACAKVNGQSDWYLKCVECPGLETCQAGKRAVQIVESETTPRSTISYKKNQERFVLALKEPDPVQWLVDNGYYEKRWRANDALKKWRQNHPDMKPSELDHYKRAGITKSNIAKGRVRTLLDGCDSPKELLLRISEKSPKCTIRSLPSKLYDWVRGYPDMCEGHPEIKQLARDTNNLFNQTHNGSMSCKEACEMLYEKKNQEEDEVSVEDFLQETVEIMPEQEVKKKVLADFTEDPSPAKHTAQLTMQTEFGKKKQELRSKINDIRAEIVVLSEKATALEQQMNMLDRVAEMFGLRAKKEA